MDNNRNSESHFDEIAEEYESVIIEDSENEEESVNNIEETLIPEQTRSLRERTSTVRPEKYTYCNNHTIENEEDVSGFKEEYEFI